MIESNVIRIVRTANAQATANWANTTAGIANVTGRLKYFRKASSKLSESGDKRM